jgi:di/tricarboxylate transporter
MARRQVLNIFDHSFLDTFITDSKKLTFEDRDELRKIIEELRAHKNINNGSALLFALLVIGCLTGIIALGDRFDWGGLLLICGFIGMLSMLLGPVQRFLKMIADTLSGVMDLMYKAQHESSDKLIEGEVRLNKILSKYGYESINGEVRKI